MYITHKSTYGDYFLNSLVDSEMFSFWLTENIFLIFLLDFVLENIWEKFIITKISNFEIILIILMI